MSKWADFGISAVRYDREHTHIDTVIVHEDPGERIIDRGKEWRRADVVSALEENKTFVTILKNKEGEKWKKGRPVHVVHAEKFIRTNHNGRAGDNLGRL